MARFSPSLSSLSLSLVAMRNENIRGFLNVTLSRRKRNRLKWLRGFITFALFGTLVSSFHPSLPTPGDAIQREKEREFPEPISSWPNWEEEEEESTAKRGSFSDEVGIAVYDWHVTRIAA